MAKDGEAQEKPSSVPVPADQTPISSSGIVPKSGAGRDEASMLRARRYRRRDSDPPSYRALTPYQARLDVEMDDTAVSKVRDPSVSISLDAEKSPLLLKSLFRGNRREALLSMAVGIAFGSLLVATIAIVIRACS